MRTAISPRLAMRSLWIVMDCLQASHVDLCDRLTGHHGLLILGKEADDLARCACLHLVERLRHAEVPDHAAKHHPVAIGFVGWLVRRWLAVEYAAMIRRSSSSPVPMPNISHLRPWPAAP